MSVEKRREIWIKIKELWEKEYPKIPTPALSPEDREKVREFLSKLYELFKQYVETLPPERRKEVLYIDNVAITYDTLLEIIKRDMQAGTISRELYLAFIEMFG